MLRYLAGSCVYDFSYVSDSPFLEEDPMSNPALTAYPVLVAEIRAKLTDSVASEERDFYASGISDAEAMKESFVDAKDDWANLRLTIAERWLRAPKATFVYSVKR